MTLLERMKADAHQCNQRAHSVWGKGFTHIPSKNSGKTDPRILAIPDDLRQKVIQWYTAGKSRKEGLEFFGIKEHMYRKIINEFKGLDD